MHGYDLKEGKYDRKNVSEEELWAVFASFFSNQTTMVSTYKYGFLKAIMDNLYNTDDDLILSFDQLFSKFGEIYWNLILKHKLKQQSKKKTYLEQILLGAIEKYNLPDEIPFESLSANIMTELSYEVKKKCKTYVVGALFEDTKGLFYSFSKKEEWIQINPLMYSFICKHKIVIEKLNYYEWARLLEKINGEKEVSHLLCKIDESAKRNNLSFYRDILFEEFENKCFYCGKPVTKNSVHVDHFIPWSFIKDDNLWNFVLACPKCNESKNDKLAPRTQLDLLIQRNEQIIIERPNISLMKNYQAKRLINIYSWASDNGYIDIWTPPQRKVANGYMQRVDAMKQQVAKM